MNQWEVYNYNNKGLPWVTSVLYDEDCSREYVYNDLVAQQGYPTTIYIYCEQTDEEYSMEGP